MNEFRSKNQWAIILGGSSGLGLASAHKLAQNGMNLIIIHRDRRSEIEPITEEFEKIRANEVELETFNVDAVNQNKVNALIESIHDILKEDKVKLLLHSISKGNLKPITTDENSLKSDDFALTIESMSISLFIWARGLLQKGLFDKDARILSFTSEGSERVYQNYAAVSAAKASLESISRSLALELAPYNVKSNCIQAGTTKTKSFSMIPGSRELEKFSIMRNPYKRLTEAEDVANVVYLMCLTESSWINGTTIKVNGGEHLQ